jgi:hypothetical protein
MVRLADRGRIRFSVSPVRHAGSREFGRACHLGGGPVVEHELAEAGEGRFRVEPLMFHLAGIPTYLIVAEPAISQVLRGELPRPSSYPEKLRVCAARRWRGTAHVTLAYAKANHAPAGRLTEVAGAIATAAVQAGHAVLAAGGRSG